MNGAASSRRTPSVHATTSPWWRRSVSVDDLMRHFNRLKPTVIHFSGHGRGPGLNERRDASGEGARDVHDVHVERARWYPAASRAGRPAAGDLGGAGSDDR